MNRELTRRETVLLLILVVLVIFLGYFKLIFEPIQDQVWPSIRTRPLRSRASWSRI